MLFAHIYFGSAAKGLTNALAGGQISTRRCRRRRLVGCVTCGILGRSGRQVPARQRKRVCEQTLFHFIFSLPVGLADLIWRTLSSVLQPVNDIFHSTVYLRLGYDPVPDKKRTAPSKDSAASSTGR